MAMFNPILARWAETQAGVNTMIAVAQWQRSRVVLKAVAEVARAMSENTGGTARSTIVPVFSMPFDAHPSHELSFFPSLSPAGVSQVFRMPGVGVVERYSGKHVRSFR